MALQPDSSATRWRFAVACAIGACLHPRQHHAHGLDAELGDSGDELLLRPGLDLVGMRRELLPDHFIGAGSGQLLVGHDLLDVVVGDVDSAANGHAQVTQDEALVVFHLHVDDRRPGRTPATLWSSA